MKEVMWQIVLHVGGRLKDRYYYIYNSETGETLPYRFKTQEEAQQYLASQQGQGGNTVSSQAPSQMSGTEITRGFVQAFRQAPSQGQGGNSYSSYASQGQAYPSRQQPTHGERVNQRIQEWFATCEQAKERREAFINLPENPPLPDGTRHVELYYQFPEDGSVVQLPGYLVPKDVILYRGTTLDCQQFDPEYNFRQWATWWFWTYENAKMYTGTDQGCVGKYIIREDLRLLDFWNFRTILLIEYLARNGFYNISNRERDALLLYTGRSIQKDRIILTAAEQNLLDTNDPSQGPDTPFRNRYRPPIPDAWQFEDKRCLKWGPQVNEFDHSSTRTLDQEMSRFISRAFEHIRIDGVMIPFQVPSTMHRKGPRDIGDIHSEIFLFPDTIGSQEYRRGALRLNFLGTKSTHQGGRKKTRKQKKTKSKTFKKKKSMPK